MDKCFLDKRFWNNIYKPRRPWENKKVMNFLPSQFSNFSNKNNGIKPKKKRFPNELQREQFSSLVFQHNTGVVGPHRPCSTKSSRNRYTSTKSRPNSSTKFCSRTKFKISSMELSLRLTTTRIIFKRWEMMNKSSLSPFHSMIIRYSNNTSTTTASCRR